MTEIDATELLPADDASYGFDNIAASLRMSPTLVDRYLAAARKISRAAVGSSAAPPAVQVYHLPPDLPQERHLEGLPLGTRGGTLVRYHSSWPASRSRRRIFTCRPTAPENEGPCAAQILSTLARRAYRRPPSEVELDRLLTSLRPWPPDATAGRPGPRCGAARRRAPASEPRSVPGRQRRALARGAYRAYSPR